MKATLAFFSLVITALAADPPPAPTALVLKDAGRGSVTINTKETATGKAITHNWESDYGSYDRDFARSKTITIDVINLGRTPTGPATELDVVWFSQKLADKKIGVFHREIQSVTVGSGTHGYFATTMPTLESSVLNLAALREKYVSGAKILGWAVLLRNQASVAAYRCSTPTIEGVLRDTAKLTPMLEEYAELSKRDR